MKTVLAIGTLTILALAVLSPLHMAASALPPPPAAVCVSGVNALDACRGPAGPPGPAQPRVVQNQTLALGDATSTSGPNVISACKALMVVNITAATSGRVVANALVKLAYHYGDSDTRITMNVASSPGVCTLPDSDATASEIGGADKNTATSMCRSNSRLHCATVPVQAFSTVSVATTQTFYLNAQVAGCGCGIPPLVNFVSGTMSVVFYPNAV